MLKMDSAESWDGHEPATSAALLDVIIKAATGSSKLSEYDRLLFAACEFWASVRNRTLLAQLSDDASDPISQLQAAELAFTVMGLRKVPSILQRGRAALMDGRAPGTLQKVAESIEMALSNVDERVDDTIAEFANRKVD